MCYQLDVPDVAAKPFPKEQCPIVDPVSADRHDDCKQEWPAYPATPRRGMTSSPCAFS
jgi:hypothetical protein